MKAFCIELTDDNLEAIQEVMNQVNEANSDAIHKEAAELGISYSAMADIHYLRTRSRWTERKEAYLIHLARSGQPSPFIMEDFEVPESFS